MRARYLSLLLLWLAATAGAQSVRLPLGGYYHPGRWMPLQWDVPAGSDIRIFGPGAATTLVTSAGPRGVAPCLAMGILPDGLRWQINSAVGRVDPANLHPLESDERLVGLCADDASLAGELFPGHPVVVPLDGADPLPGPAMAWQSLDAAVVSPQALARISPRDRAQLCAAGVTLAVPGARPGEDGLEWEQLGRLWVARAPLQAPPMIDGRLYANLSLPSGRSAAYRIRIVLLAALVCILAAGLALVRWRWMPAAQVALAAAAVGGLWWWNQGQSPIATAYGQVFVAGKALAIEDRWYFQTSPREAELHLAIDGTANPVFCEGRQREFTELEISCDSRGQARAIWAKLRPDWPLAVVMRRPAGVVPEAAAMASSPLRVVAADASMYPNIQHISQAAASSQSLWPALVLKPR